MKKLFVSLLIGLSVFSVGCNEKVTIKEVDTSETVVENNKINELRTRLIEECNIVNSSNNHPYTASFKIDEVNDEVRFVIIAPSEEYKFYTKADMETLHYDIYKIVINEMKYDGNVYTDFAVYDEFNDIYNVYNSFTYASNGDEVLLHRDENYTKHGFLKYYNN